MSLYMGELPDIEPGCGEVRVKLHVSGVIHGDMKGIECVEH